MKADWLFRAGRVITYAMKRPRIPTKQPQPAARPLQPDELTRIRGGHAQVDPIAGAFHNSDPVAADQR